MLDEKRVDHIRSLFEKGPQLLEEDAEWEPDSDCTLEIDEVNDEPVCLATDYITF